MRVVACTVAVLLCLLPAGCRMFGKKQAAAPGKDAAGDPGLRADRTTPPPAFDRTSPPPGVNGMLAGQVLDGTSRRAPAAFIQVAEFGTAGAAPIEVPADNQGYFTIQGLQVGRRYVLTARARNGSHELAGKTWATAPDPKVVIRLSEDYQPPPPRDVKADTAPPGGQADTRAPATGQRRAAELGPPSITPAPRPPNVLPERPDAKADFRPDKTASDPGLAHNEPPKVEIAPWAPPRSASQPPGESPAPLVSTQPDFGPTRVPSCILTGETLHNFALNDLSGQPWEFRSHRGRVVLIDFWGTWCLPCLQSIPHLRILQDRYGPYGLEVIGIAYEEDGSPQEQAQRVARVRQRLGVNYQVLLASKSTPCPVRTQFGVMRFPTLVLLDSRGRIVWRSEGLGPQELRELEIIIRQQLVAR